MAVTYSLALKIVLEFTTRPQTNENQVRGWFNQYERWARSRALPPTWTVNDLDFGLKVQRRVSDGRWFVYPKMVLELEVPDGTDVYAELDALMAEARAQLLGEAGGVGNQHQMQLVRFHYHLGSGSVDEIL